MTHSAPDHSKISPTAKLVAYWRQYSDIPFAQEVAKLVRAEEVLQSFFKDSNSSSTSAFIENMSWFAPMIEARYKSMVSAIQHQNIKQVLELASGVSLRGLAMTSDPEMIYVETDLPGMSAEKKDVVEKIREQNNLPKRKNLFFQDVNVLNLADLEQAILPFSKGSPIAIIHEGLFQYLSLEEKRVTASNFHSLLKRFGGVWMTPDLNTKEDMNKHWAHSDLSKQMIENIKVATQRDFKEAAFDSPVHVQRFFEELGFEIEVSPQMDSSFELSSVKKFNIPQDTLSAYMAHLKLWTLRVKA